MWYSISGTFCPHFYKITCIIIRIKADMQFLITTRVAYSSSFSIEEKEEMQLIAWLKMINLRQTLPACVCMFSTWKYAWGKLWFRKNYFVQFSNPNDYKNRYSTFKSPIYILDKKLHHSFMEFPNDLIKVISKLICPVTANSILLQHLTKEFRQLNLLMLTSFHLVH